ncbi:LysR family transcriptional regulator [Pseudoduganella plicata]|uniref:LysR family transcriptional regulator n=1 Tax=Pseudoduganella plicata TaxID=321984 RepID=A0A4P7BDE5_9BURK|nr:LysR family transcriptional regulator [Pseudoduganella plicata]QBQ35515.1 LysR family transcriptional regulator [Pseudoduganella plicata]GGY97271.1 LysR family transcriptional regulator [Pseudoduganella plicata]
MDLLALADFNLVARHGGFGRATRASGRPKATLSRRVLELEAALGVRLLERGARTLKLTQEGEVFHARMAPLLLEIDETVTALKSGASAVSGRLRISAPLLFAQMALGKLAARFALAYPHVRLEITTEDRAVDMVEEGYDLAIRVNPDPDATLVGRIILRDRLAVVAHPGIARPLGDEPAAAVLRADGGGAAAWTLQDGARIAIEPRLRLSSLVMVRDAVVAGVGAACLPVSLVSREVAAGRLLQWGELDAAEIAISALYPSRRLLSPRVAAFLDLLKTVFPNGTTDELAACMSAT